jgi:hypothetical protein
MTGNGEAAKRILQNEKIQNDKIQYTFNNFLKQILKPISKRDQEWREAFVVPVFVISDLHIHHERNLYKNNSNNSDDDIPVQPLFDRDSGHLFHIIDFFCTYASLPGLYGNIWYRHPRL